MAQRKKEDFLCDLARVTPFEYEVIQKEREEFFEKRMCYSIGQQSERNWYKIPNSDIHYFTKILKKYPKCEMNHTFIWQSGLYRNLCKNQKAYYRFASHMVKTFGTPIKEDITLYRGITLNRENINNVGCSWTPNINTACYFSGNYLDGRILQVTIPKGTKVYRVNDCKELKDTVLQAKYYDDDEYIIPIDTLSNLSINTVQMNDELGQVA